MAIFSRKNIDSKEYLKLLNQISELEIDMKKINTEQQEQRTLMNSLRGLINRKLSGDPDQTENSINPDGLDELRRLARKSGAD